MALATHRVARLTERQFRADRHPWIAVDWADCVRDGDYVHIAAMVKNVSRGPLTVHRIDSGVVNVFHNNPAGNPMLPMTVERVLQPSEGYPVAFRLGVPDADFRRALAMRLSLIGVLTLSVVVSALGVDIRETWQGIGQLHHRVGHADAFRVDGSPMTSAKNKGFCYRLQQHWQAWCRWNTDFRSG